MTKTHSRPYTSTDNPYSEAHFKTLKYRPEFPDRFDSIEQAREFCRGFFRWYNHEHRHSGIGLMTPAAVHYGQAQELYHQRAVVLAEAYARSPERFVRRVTRPTRAADRRLDQQARYEGGRSLNSTTKRLTGLDRLRWPCRLAHRPGVRIAHIGDVDAPEVGRIARDFRKWGEGNRASLSL